MHAVTGGTRSLEREARDDSWPPSQRSATMAADDFEVPGNNSKALFTLKVHRGDGMALVAMNWKQGKPSDDFVGFAIESREPGEAQFFPLPNRINFPAADGSVVAGSNSSLVSPFQKFRWVHFPPHADLPGAFTYRVTPLFMDAQRKLTAGQAQTADIELRRETYPGALNVAYTRGFISSQAFVDKYEKFGPISTLLPALADDGLKFKPTHPKAQDAYDWMGFEARRAILDLLDEAIADAQAQVRVVAYDFNQPEVVSRIEKLGKRVRVIIDDSSTHGAKNSAESQAAARVAASAGAANVKRQHVSKLQHNKTVVVDGPNVKAAVCGSTNLSWRGFFVQSNNAVVVRGASAIAPFVAAFDAYWSDDSPASFGGTPAAAWTPLGLTGIDAQISFSPHLAANARLDAVAQDIRGTKSSLLYSLAFLYETPGKILNAIQNVTGKSDRFVYGISDRKVGGLNVQKPGGNVAPVYPSQLAGKSMPEPFKSESTGGSGTRMHHKFVVVDFDLPTARVYLGSYNFSTAADLQNGENLVLIRDRRVAVSYAVEALSMFDHYHFRVTENEAKKKQKAIQLVLPPKKKTDKTWWADYYTVTRKIRDRIIFS
jgi:phosphatidylserine/phosphatidylglycerophosphate/cardiolipin synthase-like enzyme